MMARSEMARVYRLLLTAREQGIIPWKWIVDETREFERVTTWDNPEQYVRAVARSYRRDFWNQQPVRVEVWSEKGTVRGVLQPVLDHLAVGFRVMHGFSSGTVVHDIAEDVDGRDLIALYVGDFDPSGMFMSEVDLPKRLAEYGGNHITVKRIALTRRQVRGLPSFPVSAVCLPVPSRRRFPACGAALVRLDGLGAPQTPPPQTRRTGSPAARLTQAAHSDYSHGRRGSGVGHIGAGAPSVSRSAANGGHFPAGAGRRFKGRATCGPAL